ncbi:MAG: AAA family ATPase [Candidatus Binataceae bacterium]|jgi:SpoVK/Ycf46/Vps4 family AAA+-type ATPase
MEIPVHSRAATALLEIFESGRPLVYVRSAEEGRVADLLRNAGRQLRASKPLPVWTWSLTEGLSSDERRAQTGGHDLANAAEARAQDPREVLDFIATHSDPAIFHLKDFHEPMRDSAGVRRRLRDLYQICLDRQKFIVITSPLRVIPEEIERSLAVIDLLPPDLTELVEFLRSEADQITARGPQADTSEEVLYQLARTLQGLTLDEARHAVRRALLAGRSLGIESAPALLEEKRIVIKRSGVIEYVAHRTSIEEIGGLETLKEWLLERRKLFEQRDTLSADIVPKGVLVMGIPGCGKSLSVKAIASCFELPLYRIDMIEIFSGRHGKPEGAFVEACRTLESMAPAIVWFDEIEMGITSADAGGQQGRIFAFFLTWMQEKEAGLFVAATANRIDLLPAEMIRKGRFDEVFFVDLPHDEERIAIFKVHLARRGVDPSQFNFQQIMQFTSSWTGAEIEQCVISALTRARLEDRKVTENDLVNASVGGIPLSRAMKEQINHIRQWAFQRAVRASPGPVAR